MIFLVEAPSSEGALNPSDHEASRRYCFMVFDLLGRGSGARSGYVRLLRLRRYDFVVDQRDRQDAGAHHPADKVAHDERLARSIVGAHGIGY